MRPVVIVFAKAPLPGRVKTRLLPVLAPAQAAELHEAFVRDLLTRLGDWKTPFDIELHTDIRTDAWLDLDVTRRAQVEGNLELKLLHALRQALELERRPRALLVGADSPTLPLDYLDELLAAPADVALGPTEDGGYYGIACGKMAAAMFDGVEWSTAFALEQTAAACRRCGLTVSTGSRWFDVDEPADLRRLAGEGERLPPHTSRVLAKLTLVTK